MSNVKKFFKNHKSLKVLASSSLDTAGRQIESADFIQTKIEQNNKFIPNIDFTTSSNFARYGSVQKYYKDSFYYVYSEYPYDGSRKEKVSWELSGTYFDKYVFDELYPRTNGYVNLGYNYGSVSPSSGEFSTPGNIEYIHFKGGPHRAPNLPVTTLKQQFTSSNVYDANTRQESNIEIDGNYGFSLEFWLKKDGWSASNESRRQVILDVWNSGTVDTLEEGRFLVFLDRSPGGKFNVNIRSGSVINEISIGSELPITGNSWNYYSLTFKNQGSNLITKLYRNGNYLATNTTSSIGRVTGSMIGYIGALATDSGAGDAEGDGKLSGSLDDLRLWKVDRTPEQVGRNWFTQVYGGTNSDYNTEGTGSAKYSPGNPVDLGVYFKFNEGIYNTSSVSQVDQNVLDYSGRASNGTWVGYSLGARQTGSAFVESSASISEFKDPILYEEHHLVKNKLNDLSISGSLYDARNGSNIFKTLPSWMQEEDLKNDRGVLENLTQIVGSYFDTLHLQIESVPKLKNINYLSSSSKPIPFTNRIIDSTGFSISELFNDATAIEMYADRDDFREYQNKLSDVKNRIYSNIHNNLIGILKSKGTEKSFRNLIRCYGVDEQLLKLNLYGNNVTHLIRDNFEDVSTIKKYASFNSEARQVSTIYQQSSSLDTTNTRSYISGTTEMEYIGNTYETEIIFPKIGVVGFDNYYSPTYQTSSLFGGHTPPIDNPNTIMYASDDVFGFDVQAVRDRVHDNSFRSAAYFRISGTLIPELTSSLFNNVYDNSRWNFSARIKPSSYPYAGSLSGTVSSSYDFIFTGYNAISDEIVNQFTLTSSLSHDVGKRFITSSKRFYLGAQRENFTGSIKHFSGVKATSLRAWMTYLEDNTLKAHAIDSTNYGVKNPLDNAYRTSVGENFAQNVPIIPQIDTLALHWNFDSISGSDASGEFLVDDFSSGSQAEATKYSWLGSVSKYQHTGRGDFFPSSDTGSIQRDFILTAQQQQPEVLNSSNMIELVGANDDSVFTRETRPMSFYFSVEKSPYAIVTDEMIKLFATVIDFNNLIGDPVNRYRLNYKQMEKARQKFFERMENDTIDFEKFVDYYKWFDNSISLTLSQLFPASADFSERVRTLIESHALERNKYWNKFPTIDTHKRGTIHLNAAMRNVATENTGSNWSPEQGDPNPELESEIKKLKKATASGEKPKAGSLSSVAQFTEEGEEYYPDPPQIKYAPISPTLKINADLTRVTSGGSEESPGNKPEFIKGELETGTDKKLEIDGEDVEGDGELGVEKKEDPNKKEKLDYNLKNNKDGDGYGSISGKLGGNFKLFNDGVKTGFASELNTGFKEGTSLNNYHNDFTEPETPMQSPFTERWVGGNQHRHVDLNKADANGNLNTAASRPEAWSISVGSNKIEMSARAVSEPRATLFRETVAKRPVNIANISHNTSSANLGNYSKNYEVLQTSGRTSNNRFFAKAGEGGFIPQTVTSSFIAKTAEYALPRFDLTGSTKTVFVNRFNAPGGPDVSALGVMNYESQEYAANNTLNFRNFIVRDPLNKFSTDHTAQFGIRSGSSVRSDDYSTNASYYKVNRNPKTLAALTNGFEGSVTHSINYDNNWINHPIPRSAFQYKWITSSATKGVNDTFGYVSNFSVPSGTTSATQSALPFIAQSVNSTNGVVTDFVGLNTLIYEPINTSERIASASSGIYANTDIVTLPDAERLNSLLLHRNGPFQYPSWKQTRVGETSISREMKKNNILSAFENGGQFSRFVVDLVGNRDKKMKSFLSKTNQTFDNQCVTSSKVEPPISFKYRPLETNILHNNSNGIAVTLRHSYGNNLASFANEEFINITKYENTKVQAYDKLKNMYSGSQTEAVLINLAYDEVIFPKDTNTGLAKVRGRLNYSEDALVTTNGSASLSDGVNGIDRIIDQRRTFWRYKDSDRNRQLLFDVEEHHAISQSLQENAQDCDREGVKITSLQTTLPNSQGEFDGMAQNIYGFGRTPITVIESPVINRTLTAPLNLSSTVGGFCGTTTAESVKSLYTDSGELNSANFLKMSSFNGYLSGSRTVGTFEYQITVYPTASALYYHRPANKFLNTTGTLGTMPWKVAELSGKRPWFDSYEEYVSDIRGNAKNYTILPEFRISQHLPYYADGNFLKQNDKFLTLDGANITSSAETEKVSGKSRGFNENFFEEYSHTDFQKYFGKFSNDLVLDKITLQCNAVKKLIPYTGFYPSHRSLQLASLFSQSLGPHISKNVVLDSPSSFWEIYRGMNTGSLGMQSLLQPYFAPGIMYNTIKAGIACDWASFSGSCLTLDNMYSGSIVRYNNGSVGEGGVIVHVPDFRTPFEAILDPLSEIGIPISQSEGSGSLALATPTYPYYPFTNGTAYFDAGEVMQPRHPFVDIDNASRKTAQTSNNYRLYKLAINNFFAEIPNFFIQGNGLSTIVSKRQQEVSLVSGTTYYMDVYLDKSDDVVMTDSYLNGTNDVAHQTRASGTLITYNGQVFGPPAKFGDSGLEFTSSVNTNYPDPHFLAPELMSPENCGDPAYAPWTPPYFYGKSSATIRYTADDEDEKGGFSYKKLFEKSYVEYKNDELTSIFDKYNKRSSYIEWEVTPGANGDFEASGSLLDDNLNYYMQAVKTQTTSDWDTGLSPALSHSVGPGQFYEWSIPDITKNTLSGLNNRPRSTNTYTDIEFAIQVDNGRILVWESNSNVFTSPDFPVENEGFVRIKIETDGSVLYQYTNESQAQKSLSGNQKLQQTDTPIIAYGINYVTVYKSAKKYDDWRTGEYGELFPDATLYNSGSSIIYAQIGNARTLPAEHGQMRLTASINTFGIFSEKETKLDKNGNLVEVVDSPNSDRDRWSISTKMETPVLNFANQPYEEGSHRGMWSGYGVVPTASEGITFGVEETFKGAFPKGSDSLLKKCFDLPDKRKVGQVAEKKIISEAIVAIPFTYDVHNKKSKYAETVQILNKNLFKIDQKMFDYYYDWLETSRGNEKAQDPEKMSESITNMLRSLDKYVLPPELDFITFNQNKDRIKPFVAYVFEFNHEFDTEDLADIWQGVMPKIAETAELSDTSVDNNVFSHPTGTREFFHGKKLPPETRWMVFKVKRKANDNYYKLTSDTKDDSKFDFRFNVGKLELPYSYNWPYDYFSLVELADIEVENNFVVSKPTDEEQ